MEIARIRVSGVKVHVLSKKIITAGMIGAEIALEFDDPVWGNLQKTVVFNGNTIKDVINPGMVVSIPPEVMSSPAKALYVGVYGTDSDNNEAIPTLWANLGEIHTAADPSGDETTDPSIPVYAQLLTLKTGPQGPQGATGTVDKSNITVTLAVARWSSLAQTVNASGITSNNTVIVSPSSGSHNAYNEAGVYCSAQASGKLTFRCSEKPSVALTVNVLIIN